MSEERPVDWRRELSHIWPLLVPAADQAIVTAPVQSSPAGWEVLVGVDVRRSRHLLIRCDESSKVEDRSSAYVQITTRDLVIDGTQAHYADLVCYRDDLADLFDDILADVFEELLRAQEAGPACVRVLNRWRDLLRRQTGPLTEGVARGLFAELLVLERILGLRHRVKVSEVWRGPDRAPHDFELERHSLEVKAVGEGPPIVEVNGLDQLDQCEDRTLHVVTVQLREDAEGRRLPDLVDDVLGRTADRRGVLNQLAKVGFSPADERDWYHPYLPVQIHVMTVSESFPRIVRGSFGAKGLARDVIDVSYRLDLTSQLPLSGGDEALRRIVGDGLPA